MIKGGLFKEKKIVNKIFGDFIKYNDSRNMNQNHSLSPVDYTFVAPRRLEIKNIILFISDPSQIQFELFGSITELTNGLRVWYKQKSTDDKIYLDAGFPIKSNSDFAKLSIDIEIKPKSAGDNVFAGRWDFKEHFGDNLMLEKGGSFGITINDDLSGINMMTIFVKGYFSSNP